MENGQKVQAGDCPRNKKLFARSWSLNRVYEPETETKTEKEGNCSGMEKAKRMARTIIVKM